MPTQTEEVMFNLHLIHRTYRYKEMRPMKPALQSLYSLLDKTNSDDTPTEA